jgi:hypothetical protein
VSRYFQARQSHGGFAASIIINIISYNIYAHPSRFSASTSVLTNSLDLGRQEIAIPGFGGALAGLFLQITFFRNR